MFTRKQNEVLQAYLYGQTIFLYGSAFRKNLIQGAIKRMPFQFYHIEDLKNLTKPDTSKILIVATRYASIEYITKNIKQNAIIDVSELVPTKEDIKLADRLNVCIYEMDDDWTCVASDKIVQNILQGKNIILVGSGILKFIKEIARNRLVSIVLCADPTLTIEPELAIFKMNGLQLNTVMSSDPFKTYNNDTLVKQYVFWVKYEHMIAPDTFVKLDKWKFTIHHVNN